MTPSTSAASQLGGLKTQRTYQKARSHLRRWRTRWGRARRRQQAARRPARLRRGARTGPQQRRSRRPRTSKPSSQPCPQPPPPPPPRTQHQWLQHRRQSALMLAAQEKSPQPRPLLDQRTQPRRLSPSRQALPPHPLQWRRHRRLVTPLRRPPHLGAPRRQYTPAQPTPRCAALPALLGMAPSPRRLVRCYSFAAQCETVLCILVSLQVVAAKSYQIHRVQIPCIPSARHINRPSDPPPANLFRFYVLVGRSHSFSENGAAAC